MSRSKPANPRPKDKTDTRLRALYDQALPAKRTGSLFCAFPYPTKISPEAIALYIAAHTKPGDTVFDGFAGSGTTGLAALLCERPSAEMQAEAKRLKLAVNWGPRNAVLYELSSLGAFVGRTLTNPPDPKAFLKAAQNLLLEAKREDGWLYAAIDPQGNAGEIRYAVWSDVLVCPRCACETTYWDACASRNPAKLSSRFKCSSCGHGAAISDVKHATDTVFDSLLGTKYTKRKSRIVWLYGQTGKKKWSRAVAASDAELLKKIEGVELPESTPKLEIPWGDLYRSGYHEGITHLHHFYTPRNLAIFARLWERTSAFKGALRDALRFWLLSYNASHATVMTRIVAKTGQRDFVVTSAQPGVLYVSSLPVEKNLYLGLERKLSTIVDAFSVVHGRTGKVRVVNGSSCKLDLREGCIDYAFTDPPFGGNIPYSEINFVNEGWLGTQTQTADEAIVSSAQGKTITDYQNLLTKALTEVRRVLRPQGKATLVFHSSTAEVWTALQDSYRHAGFDVEFTSVLDKKQGSFKQVTTEGSVKGDPILLLRKADERTKVKSGNAWHMADRVRRKAEKAVDPAERTPQRMYSRLVNQILMSNQEVTIDADSFYRWHQSQTPIQIEVGAD